MDAQVSIHAKALQLKTFVIAEGSFSFVLKIGESKQVYLFCLQFLER